MYNYISVLKYSIAHKNMVVDYTIMPGSLATKPSLKVSFAKYNQGVILSEFNSLVLVWGELSNQLSSDSAVEHAQFSSSKYLEFAMCIQLHEIALSHCQREHRLKNAALYCAVKSN